MIFVFLSVAFIYIVLIVFFIIGFNRIQQIENKSALPKNTFSIIVPFRNEAKNLPELLNSLKNLNYLAHLFEIIFVNDASEDISCEIIEAYQQQFYLQNTIVLQNKRATASPKKDAINNAISIAKFEWIVCTDADCSVPINWLQIFNQFIETKNPVFIAAPVKLKKQESLLFHFQNLNFISLIGSTIGSFGIKKPIMCNGANLCYKKTAFISVNGFDGNNLIASGDDIFLLEKMVKKFSNQVLFLKSKDAIVLTNSETTWKSYINQQLRWASKSTSYNDNFSKFVGFIVMAINLIVPILFIKAIFNAEFWHSFLAIFTLKSMVDFMLIKKTSTFLKSNNSLKYYLIVALLYPLFITYIAFFSLFKSYTWKGRTFKK
jgi:cellulose synthase/poly-beta-1,6-N-acetylglucosamine synthase-like glycosyltransferase